MSYLGIENVLEKDFKTVIIIYIYIYMLAIFHSMVLVKLVGNRWKGTQTVKSLRCARIQKLALEVFVGVFLNFGESKLAACPPAPSLYG